MIALENKEKKKTKDRILSIIPPSTSEMFSPELGGCHLLNPAWWTVSSFILYQKQLVSGHKLILERMLSDNPPQFPGKENISIWENFQLGFELADAFLESKWKLWSFCVPVRCLCLMLREEW